MSKLKLCLARKTDKDAPIITIGLSDENTGNFLDGIYLSLNPNIPIKTYIKTIQAFNDRMPEDITFKNYLPENDSYNKMKKDIKRVKDTYEIFGEVVDKILSEDHPKERLLELKSQTRAWLNDLERIVDKQAEKRDTFKNWLYRK